MLFVKILNGVLTLLTFYTNLLFTNEVLIFEFYVLTHHAVFNEVM